MADWIENELCQDLFTLDPTLTHPEPHVPPVNSSAMKECAGVPVEWTPGSVWDTYPFHQHGIRAHPWEPIAFEGNDSWLRLRSKQCCIVLSGNETNASGCARCAAIPASPAFKKFISRAMLAQDHTPYEFLTHRQLLKLMRSILAKYRKLSSQVRL